MIEDTFRINEAGELRRREWSRDRFANDNLHRAHCERHCSGPVGSVRKGIRFVTHQGVEYRADAIVHFLQHGEWPCDREQLVERYSTHSDLGHEEFMAPWLLANCYRKGRDFSLEDLRGGPGPQLLEGGYWHYNRDAKPALIIAQPQLRGGDFLHRIHCDLLMSGLAIFDLGIGSTLAPGRCAMMAVARIDDGPRGYPIVWDIAAWGAGQGTVVSWMDGIDDLFGFYRQQRKKQTITNTKMADLKSALTK